MRRAELARHPRSGNTIIEDIQELLGHSSFPVIGKSLGKMEAFRSAITSLIEASAPTV
jgi:hypothetical protein